jgi:Metal-dependent amidase/aminoacylase/carboxypeptidase
LGEERWTIETKEELLPQIIELRHQFHKYPEVSNHEFETTKKSPKY